MLPHLLFIASTLFPCITSSLLQERFDVPGNDASDPVSESSYYAPTKDIPNAEKQTQKNLVEFEKFFNQVKRVHTGEQMSLSIMNPLDVLRQKLLLELSNRRYKQKQDQIRSNYDYLRQIG